jgi:hypothetical protein
MSREAWASALIALALGAGAVGIVALAIAGAFGASLPAWWGAACGLAGAAIGWAINTPRRP